jgi:hypothetical protein
VRRGLIRGVVATAALILVLDVADVGQVAWRLLLLPVALLSVLIGLVALLRLGRDELRRLPVPGGAYVRAIAPFVLAVVLASVALG